MNSSKLEKILFAICILYILLYIIFAYHKGEDSYFLVHDNHHQVYYSLLNWNNYFSLQATIPNVMNGLPISSISRGFNFGEVLHLIVKTFFAFVLNETISRLVALVGMFLLLKRYILKAEDTASIIIRTGVSLCFAMIPHYPTWFITITGQPLLLYVFLNLKSGEKKILNWVIISIYPFYSDLARGGFAVYIIIVFILLFDLVKKREINKLLLIGLLMMGLFYILANYKLFYNFFLDKNYVSNRSEYQALRRYNITETMKIVSNNFKKGQYHSASMQEKFIRLSALIALLFCYWEKNKRKWLIGGLLIAFFLSLIYGFWFYFLPRLPNITLIKAFQWERLHFLHPLLWTLIFAISLDIISSRSKYLLLVIFLFLIAQLQYCTSESYNLNKSSKLTFRQYTSPELFKEIKETIGKPQNSYRVVSIGLMPEIATYNGFYTLDGYFASYPLSYKHEFRKIIERELKKNFAIKNYFDNWGARCYILVADLSKTGKVKYFSLKDSIFKIYKLQLNIEQFVKMGGEYIFSALEIPNYKDNKLRFIKMFDSEKSAYRVFLYQVELERIH